MWPYPQETVDLETFAEQILHGKLHFLCSISFIEVANLNCANIYSFKVENVSSNHRRSGAFIVNFEHILHLFLVFALLTSNKYTLAGHSVVFFDNIVIDFEQVSVCLVDYTSPLKLISNGSSLKGKNEKLNSRSELLMKIQHMHCTKNEVSHYGFLH